MTVILTAPTVVIIRYRTPRFNKIFGSYFFVFGKCGVTPRRLYRGSLTSRLNLILKRVILLSVLAIFSVPNKIFSMTFLSSYMIKCFKPSTPKESKKKICFWLYIKYNLPVCLAFFTAVSFSNNEGIFALFLRYYRCMVNKFIHMIRRKNTKLSFKSSSSMFFMAFSI